MLITLYGSMFVCGCIAGIMIFASSVSIYRDIRLEDVDLYLKSIIYCIAGAKMSSWMVYGSELASLEGFYSFGGILGVIIVFIKEDSIIFLSSFTGWAITGAFIRLANYFNNEISMIYMDMVISIQLIECLFLCVSISTFCIICILNKMNINIHLYIFYTCSGVLILLRLMTEHLRSYSKPRPEILYFQYCFLLTLSSYKFFKLLSKRGI